MAESFVLLSGERNVVLQWGATWRPVLARWTQNLQTRLFTPVDLSNYDMFIEFRETDDMSETPFLTLSTLAEDGGITKEQVAIEASETEEAGSLTKFYPVLSADEIDAFEFTSGTWLVKVQHSDTTVTRLITGTFRIE